MWWKHKKYENPQFDRQRIARLPVLSALERAIEFRWIVVNSLGCDSFYVLILIFSWFERWQLELVFYLSFMPRSAHTMARGWLRKRRHKQMHAFFVTNGIIYCYVFCFCHFFCMHFVGGVFNIWSWSIITTYFSL